MKDMNTVITRLISVDADIKWVAARFLEKRGVAPKVQKFLRKVACAQDDLVDRRTEDALRRSQDL